MKKTRAVSTGLKVAASRKVEAVPAPALPFRRSRVPAGLVLVGAHFTPELRRGLKFLEAETGKSLKALLGEAIDDLCVKYGKPQLYGGEE